MNGLDLLRYQFGSAEAIRRAAASRSTFWVGMVLVLLTAIPRNYDQSWLGEVPVLWFLGPLLFSLVSGTWLFLVIYAGFARSHWAEEDRYGTAWRDWPRFMGLFWMTAPVAWWYALPVERWFSSTDAAWANVSLLALVSLWRILLFSRVIQVTLGVRPLTAGSWVLFPASIEAFVVLVFTALGPAVARGMGGMRFSPEEEILASALNTAFSGSMLCGLVALTGVAVTWPRTPLRRLPIEHQSVTAWRAVGGCAVVWVILAAWIQPAAWRSARLDSLVRDGHYPEAMAWMVRHGEHAFLPARPLPPKMFEYRSHQDLTGLLAELGPATPEWLRLHLKRRADDLARSLQSRRKNGAVSAHLRGEEALGEFFGLRFSRRLKSEDVLALTKWASQDPLGRQWVQENPAFVSAYTTALRDGEPEEDSASATNAVRAALEALERQLPDVLPNPSGGAVPLLSAP